MIYKIIIPGRLPSLNEYINANRAGFRSGAGNKKNNQRRCMNCIAEAVPGLRITKPVSIIYRFYERDRRRDLDNISGPAHKIINDALVKLRVLKDDGWDEITSYADEFYVDKQRPRIEIEIIENEEIDDGR